MLVARNQINHTSPYSTFKNEVPFGEIFAEIVNFWNILPRLYSLNTAILTTSNKSWIVSFFKDIIESN